MGILNSVRFDGEKSNRGRGLGARVLVMAATAVAISAGLAFAGAQTWDPSTGGTVITGQSVGPNSALGSTLPGSGHVIVSPPNHLPPPY